MVHGPPNFFYILIHNITKIREEVKILSKNTVFIQKHLIDSTILIYWKILGYKINKQIQYSERKNNFKNQ